MVEQLIEYNDFCFLTLHAKTFESLNVYAVLGALEVLQKLFESHLFAQHLKNKKVLVCFFCWSPDASHPPEEKSLTQIKSKYQKKFLCYKVKLLFSAAGRASIRLR